MSKEKKGAVNLERDTYNEVFQTLRMIRSLGDALVCIGTPNLGSLLPDTIQTLGFLIVDKANEVAGTLSVGLD